MNHRSVRAKKEPPEDSIAMRVVVGAAVEVSLVAVVAQGAVDGPSAVAGIVLAPLGYLFSYRQRARSSLATKVLLSVGLLAAFAQFLTAVRFAGSVDDARVPLGSLFVWVQVLHAFDVPRRRDLAFSMVSSLILMAEAGSLALDTSFLLFLAPWCALAGAWLWLSARPRPGTVAVPLRVRRRAGARRGARLAPAGALSVAAIAVLASSALAFMAMPRLPGTVVAALPFSLGGATPLAGFDGGVENPGLPARAGDGVVDFSPGAYPGFGDAVDLRARGRLSDEIAFRVRAPQAALWRAEAFDSYRDGTWTISDRTTFPLEAGTDGRAQHVPGEVSEANLAGGATTRLVQTFYIDTPQPNVLFAAPGPREVYFPAGGLRVDTSGSIRAPILLDRGLVYSVISEVPAHSDDLLRAAPSSGREAAGELFLLLPDALSARLRPLAERIVAGAATPHDRVLAVQGWLRRSTRYDLDVPREPAGVDPVEHFLFATRRGYCEHIASAMALLLRSIGVPTRLVTGFGPGERNPFTGYLEVRQADAHAWVEVYYPTVGWVAYDPTFGVPEASPGLGDRFVAGEVLAAVGRFLGAAIPEPVREAARAVGRGIAAAARSAVGSWPATVATALLGAVALLLVLRWIGRRRRGPPLAGAAAAFAELSVALAALGHVRREHETPGELVGSVAADPALGAEVVEAAELVVRTFERERFSPRAPAPEDVARAGAAARRVRELASSPPR